MLIGAGLETDGVSLLFLVASIDVGEEIVHRMTEVRRAVDIGDGGGKIEVF